MYFFAVGGSLPRIPTYFRNKDAFVFVVHNAALIQLLSHQPCCRQLDTGAMEKV